MADDVLSLDDIADLFRVTPESIRKWVKAGMPIVRKGKRGRGSNKTELSLKEAVAWYFNENYERLELDRERTRLAREQANKQAYDNAERSGRLGDVVEVAKWYAGHVARAATRLNTIPDAIAQRVDPKTAPVVKAAAREYIQSAVAELRADLAADGAGHPLRMEEPAHVNGQSVG